MTLVPTLLPGCEGDAGGCREKITYGLPDPAECDESCWAGCADWCCPEENGGWRTRGRCGCFVWQPSDCDTLWYTCDTALFLEPGELGWNTWGVCQGAHSHSFWYEAQVVEGVPPAVDPCPTEDPCCRALAYPAGLTMPIRGVDTFVPLDTSELAGTSWGCTGTNCSVSCTPAPGSRVRVHLRWIDAPESAEYYPIPERFVVEEICSVGSP
jgi:hypothetical protein